MFIMTLSTLLAYATVFGVMLIARTDYRPAKRVEDWDTV